MSKAEEIKYRLKYNELNLYNKFVGWNGLKLGMEQIYYQVSLYSTTLNVSVEALLKYSDQSFYTKSYVVESFKECMEQYVKEIIDEVENACYIESFDEPDIIDIHIEYQLTTEKM